MIHYNTIIRKAGFLCLLLFVAFQFTGCKCECSSEFFIQTITVIDENGSMVEDAIVTPFNPATGTALNIDSERYSLPAGVFVVMTDDFVASMEDNDLFLGVAIQKEGYETAYLEMVFGTDFCVCHFELLEGETLVQLTPAN